MRTTQLMKWKYVPTGMVVIFPNSLQCGIKTGSRKYWSLLNSVFFSLHYKFDDESVIILCPGRDLANTMTTAALHEEASLC